MMQRGMSLIELIVALLISSMLGLMLLNILNRSGSSLKSVEGIAGTDIAIATFYDRFERDIMGAFIPAIGDPDLADKAFAQQFKKQEEYDQQQQAAQQQQAQQQKKPGPLPQKKQAKPLSLQDIQVKKVCVYEEKDNNLARFSFITCNPAMVYSKENPRIVRVIYELKPEPGAQTYTLWRRESRKLSLKFGMQERAYALLKHIISLRLELLAPQVIEEKDKTKGKNKQGEIGGTQDKKKAAAPLVTFKQWPDKIAKEDSEPAKDLPQFVKVFVRYKDTIDNRIKNYEFIYPIRCFRAPSDAILKVQLIHLQREEQKKELAEQQTQQAQQAHQAKQAAGQPPKTSSPQAGLARMMAGAHDPQRRKIVG